MYLEGIYLTSLLGWAVKNLYDNRGYHNNYLNLKSRPSVFFTLDLEDRFPAKEELPVDSFVSTYSQACPPLNALTTFCQAVCSTQKNFDCHISNQAGMSHLDSFAAGYMAKRTVCEIDTKRFFLEPLGTAAVGIVSFAAFYSASVIVPALRSSVAITSASAAVTAKTQTYFRSLSDADADDCVNNNASPEQLLGGMRFYKACAIIKQGNSNQTNQTNGPLLDKIAKITEKLAEHETTVDPAKEAEVIGCLVSYYMNRM